MKRLVLIFASIAALAISCTANPPILPEPPNASTGVGGFGGDGGIDISSSVASSSASGSSGTPLPGDGSGVRLKRYVYTSADGLIAAQQYRLFDVVLQSDCVPVRTMSGTRCITGMNNAFAVQYYSDATCTIPLVYGYKGCAAPTRMQMGLPSTCVIDAVYKVVELTPYTAPTMYSASPGCLEVPTTAPGIYDVYAIGPEVDYTQFAAMTLEHE